MQRGISNRLDLIKPQFEFSWPLIEFAPSLAVFHKQKKQSKSSINKDNTVGLKSYSQIFIYNLEFNF